MESKIFRDGCKLFFPSVIVSDVKPSKIFRDGCKHNKKVNTKLINNSLKYSEMDVNETKEEINQTVEEGLKYSEMDVNNALL